MTPHDPGNAFTVGPWQVYPRESRLIMGDRDVVLEPRVMGVLVCLTAKPGRLVSADELLDTVWQGRAHSDHTIYQAIADLRKALGDNASKPQYIETIPKKGYRFIQPVTSLGSESFDVASEDAVRRRGRVVIVATLASIICIAGFSIYAVSGRLLEPSSALQGVPAIAVLPFEYLGDSADDEYLAVAIPEEILNRLARHPELRVLGRTSSFASAKLGRDRREIGQTLGANKILEGSVRRSADRIRVWAQLVNAEDSTLVWSHTYDRHESEIFALQEDVSRNISAALRVEINNIPYQYQSPSSIEAYALFLQAKVLYGEGRLLETETLLRESAALDPDFGETFELLAATYWRLGGETIPAPVGHQLMAEAASRAVEINPNLVFATALKEIGNRKEYTLLAELEALRHAATLEPGNIEILNALTWCLMVLGYFEETRAIAERAVALDPLSIVSNKRLVDALHATGAYDAALNRAKFLDQLREGEAEWKLAAIRIARGHDDAALVHLRPYLQHVERFTGVSPEEFMVSARDSNTGADFLDEFIRKVIDSAAENESFSLEISLNPLLLYFGYVDRYFQKIQAMEMAETGWTDAETLFLLGSIFHRGGFTAHSGYLPLARRLGVVDAWERYGPPAFCRQESGEWSCG